MELQVGVKAIVRNKAGKYLLLHRNLAKYPDVKGGWDIVGGRINPGVLLHENLAREIAEEIGAKGHMSKCCQSIGLLYKAKGDTKRAGEYLTRALELYRECGADVHMKETEEALKSL